MAKRRDLKPPALQIAVVTLPEWDGSDLSLREDLRRVKAAILYADSVRLFSHRAALLSAFEEAERRGGRSLVEFLAVQSDEVLDGLGLGPDEPRGIRLRVPRDEERRVRRLARSSPAGRQQAARIERALTRLETSGHPQSHVAALLDRAEAGELAQLMDAGLVVLDAHGLDLSTIGDETPEEYADALYDVLSREDSHPLFDETTSILINDLIERGNLQPAQLALTHARQVAAGTGLISRLPAFPDAKLSHVLEARGDLRERLLAFRSAVRELAEELASSALDRSLPVELDDLYRDVVVPRLNELQEGLRKTRLVAEAARAVGEDTKSVVGGALGVTIAIRMSTGLWSEIERIGAQELGAVGAAATIGSLVAVSKRFGEAREKARSDQLFYLLELDKHLR